MLLSSFRRSRRATMAATAAAVLAATALSPLPSGAASPPQSPAQPPPFVSGTQTTAAYDYDNFETCLREVDAVYLALPNSMHAEYTIRAAGAGVHVLCEKPMATTEEECLAMIEACETHHAKLMIAYRLHFETLNLSAMDLARSGRLGELKFFNSSFSMTVLLVTVRLPSTSMRSGAARS